MKPIGRKNYGSIGHLPCSRLGPADHSVHEGQQKICLEKTRDKRDRIIVTEKVDGSNVGIVRDGHTIFAIGRAGHLAQSSKYRQHQLFAQWVREREDFWRDFLADGNRLVGEWLAQAHGTVYNKIPEFGPFVAFDLMKGDKRYSHDILQDACSVYGVPTPKLIHDGGPISIEKAMEIHGDGNFGADEPEGVVYRVERDGMFDFMAKWVRPDKIDGKYLPEVADAVTNKPIWNWRP